MDAYVNYLLRTSEARLGDLRREATEHALSRAAQAARGPWWSRFRGRLRPTSPQPQLAPVTEVAPALAEAGEALRSA